MTRIIILAFLWNGFNLSAQSWDLGLCLAGSNYSGDLTENSRVAISQTRLGIGSSIRYELSNLIGMKVQYLFMQIEGADAKSKNEWQIKRNLQFRTAIHNVDLLGQINLSGILFREAKRWNPFLALGLSYFKFNPKANYNNQWVELKPLGTEGQGMAGYPEPYKLNSRALTFGLGNRFFISSNISLTLEFLWRQTKTDYLDDASTNYVDYDALKQNNGFLAAELGNKIRAIGGSQRANSSDNDWIQSCTLGISYHFGAEFKGGSLKFNRKAVNCPKFK